MRSWGAEARVAVPARRSARTDPPCRGQAPSAITLRHAATPRVRDRQLVIVNCHESVDFREQRSVCWPGSSQHVKNALALGRSLDPPRSAGRPLPDLAPADGSGRGERAAGRGGRRGAEAADSDASRYSARYSPRNAEESHAEILVHSRRRRAARALFTRSQFWRGQAPGERRQPRVSAGDGRRHRACSMGASSI